MGPSASEISDLVRACAAVSDHLATAKVRLSLTNMFTTTPFLVLHKSAMDVGKNYVVFHEVVVNIGNSPVRAPRRGRR